MIFLMVFYSGFGVRLPFQTPSMTADSILWPSIGYTAENIFERDIYMQNVGLCGRAWIGYEIFSATSSTAIRFGHNQESMHDVWDAIVMFDNDVKQKSFFKYRKNNVHFNLI